jgi:hypothetical protein
MCIKCLESVLVKNVYANDHMQFVYSILSIYNTRICPTSDSSRCMPAAGGSREGRQDR